MSLYDSFRDDYSASSQHFEGYLCINCVENDDLVEQIRNLNNYNYCSFCNSTNYSISVEQFYEYAQNLINTFYESAVEILYYDNESESGFLGNTLDTHDVLDHLFAGIIPDELIDSLKNTLEFLVYCDEDFLNNHHLEGNRFLLEEFKSGEDNHEEITKLLNEIISDFNLETSSDYLKLFRGRMKANETYTYKDLVSPPKSKAKSNRLSYENQSVFYAAFSPDIIRQELGCSDVVIGCFYFDNYFRILNLADVKNISATSIFAENAFSKNQAITFLKEFVQDLTKKDNGNNNYNWTQKIGNLLYSLGYDGIIYESATNKGEYNIALNRDNDWFLKNCKLIEFHLLDDE